MSKMASETTQSLDCLVVGAGFGGIYQLKKFLDLGLSANLIDEAGDVGGTWFWNKYPGAMSDTETYLYRYSWDLEDLKSYPWHKQYSYQPDVLEYLQHVTKRWDLRKHMQFNQSLTQARWDDQAARWIVRTSNGVTFQVRYLVTALGLLSRQNLPKIAGVNDYKGEKYHTGAWPQNVSLKGKRVGVLGNGSTGVQVITAIAKDVGHLVSFQRNPQYSVPSGQGPVPEEHRQNVMQNYDQVWKEAKDESLFAFGFKEVSRATFSVPEEERRQIYEEAWQKGGGFRFMFQTFGDITLDEAANAEASNFIKAKIRETVKDKEKARKLMPTQRYARRPLCDAGYYEQFNRDNVEIVNLQENPISHFTSDGIITQDGTEHKLDVVIFATGFDAVDGNYTRVAIQGRNGRSLKDHWNSTGPVSYLGVSVSEFPNMFMILGPNGPFCNLPPAIESQVEFISDIISANEASKHEKSGVTNGITYNAQTNGTNDIAQPNGTTHHGQTNGANHTALTNGNNHDAQKNRVLTHSPIIESTQKAEEEWTSLCDNLSAGSLFRKTDSWIFGSNVPGKKSAVMFYFGGLAGYRKQLREIADEGWKGFQVS